MLISLNHHKSTTQPRLHPFPSIRILDGEGMIMVGSGEETFQNRLSQTSFNLNNRWSTLKGKDFIEIGVDLDYSNLKNNFLLNGHGQYFYYNIKDFLQNRSPVEFNINQKIAELNEHTNLSNITIFKAALFINYKTNLGKNVRFHAGLRLDREQFLNAATPDSFTQTTAIPILKSYHDLFNAQSGKLPILSAILSPRLTFKIFIPSIKSTLQIGSGIFSGRIPYAWLSGIQSNNGKLIQHHFATGQQLRGFYFNPIYHSGNFALPPHFTTTKGSVYLGPSRLKLPAIWRSTIDIEKAFTPRLVSNTQLMHYFNITEIGFLNVNIQDPTAQLVGPDKRVVYAPSKTLTIPMLPDNSNPYDQILLIHNLHNQKGYGYLYGSQLRFQNKQHQWMIHYSFGKSFAFYDGNFSISINHWRLNEQKLGRNKPELSQSDYGQGHRIYAEYQFHMSRYKKRKFNFSMHYNGQSGNPFSYVYGGKNLSGDDPTAVGFDLIYIPTAKELKEMIFIPLNKKGWYYTPDQQKEALETFIHLDEYLKERRGLYAEKNGSRSPFSHRIDLKFNFHFPINIPMTNLNGSISLELFNAANLINQNWGQQMLVPSNRYRLIDFEGFIHPQFLLPVYNFDPNTTHASIFQQNNSLNPSSSKNWMLQLGFRLSFY
jgi:hypothetical protein